MKIAIVIDSVDSWFVEHGQELLNRLAVNHEAYLSYGLEGIQEGDIAFYLSFTAICPPEVLQLNKNNIVIHASDLPKGKGWSPMPWQIIEGKNEITLSLFEAAERVDSGDVYLKDVVVYEGHELLDELRDAMTAKILDMAETYVREYKSIIGVPQQGEDSFYAKRTAEHSEVDIDKSISEQFNLLRTVDNERYPAFFYKDGVKYILTISKES